MRQARIAAPRGTDGLKDCTQPPMTEFSANTTRMSAVQVDTDLHARIDALQRGDCSEDEFLRELLTLRKSAPNLAWTTLALIDRRFRTGNLPGELFRSIN